MKAVSNFRPRLVYLDLTFIGRAFNSIPLARGRDPGLGIAY